MLRRLSLIAIALALSAGTAFAQSSRQRGPDALTGNASVALDVSGMGTASIQIEALTSGTVYFEASTTGGDYVAIDCATPSTPGTDVNSATGTGVWTCSVAGLKYLRARGDTVVGGRVMLAAAATGGGGGGGGSVGSVTTELTLQEADDASIAAGQTADAVISLSQVFDGTVWRRATVGTAGTASSQVTTIQGIASMTPVQIADNGGSITVDGTVGVSGTVTVTATNLDVQIGGSDIVQVQSNSLSLVPGLAEDGVHSSGEAGALVLAVRQDSQVDFGADGDRVPLSIDQDGGLRVSIISGAGSGGTALADDADFTAGTTSGTPAIGFYQSSVTACTDGDACVVGITAQRTLKATLFTAAGVEITPATDWTVGSAIGTTGPGVQAVYKEFDGSALPTTTNVNTEGEAVPFAATLVGIPFSFLVNEDGSKSPLVDEDVASSDADLLMKIGVVRRDTAATSATTAGDWATLNVDQLGRLWTRTGDPCGDYARVTTAAIDTAASGNVEVVALNSGDTVYVCGFGLVASAATSVQFIYGTGTACATGETDLTGPMAFAANGGITNTNAGAVQLKTAASNALCIENSGANQVSGWVSYVRTAAP